MHPFPYTHRQPASAVPTLPLGDRPPPKSPGQGRGAGLKTPLAAALLGACMTGLSEGKSEVKIREPFSLEDPRGQGCV